MSKKRQRKERRGEVEQPEEIAIAINRAIAEVKAKFPGGVVGQVRANGEQDVVRINGNMLWPPDRATVTEQDVRHAWFAHLAAFDDYRNGPHETQRQAQDAYVAVQAAGEALLWTLRYYAQDCYALGYQSAREKFEIKQPKAEIAA